MDSKIMSISPKKSHNSDAVPTCLHHMNTEQEHSRMFARVRVGVMALLLSAIVVIVRAQAELEVHPGPGQLLLHAPTAMVADNPRPAERSALVDEARGNLELALR